MERCLTEIMASPSEEEFTSRVEIFEDTIPAMRTMYTEHMLRPLRAVFRDNKGEGVCFDDLEGDRMVGMMAYFTRHVEDLEAFKKDMPTGRWSDRYTQPDASLGEVAEGPDPMAEEGVDGLPAGDQIAHTQEGVSGQADGTDGNASLVALDSLYVRGATPPKRPIPVDGEEAESRDVPRAAIHEVLVWTDETRTTLRRKMPGVECMRHASKFRMAPSAQRYEEFRADGRSIFKCPGLTPVGALNTRRKLQRPLEAWTGAMRRGEIAERFDERGKLRSKTCGFETRNRCVGKQ